MPQSQSFLIRVLCGDTPENPGAALKAITGGREIFGFPKHPIPAELQFNYAMSADGKRESIEFKGFYQNVHAISMKCKLPMMDPEHVMIPLDVPRTSENANIGSPRLGGRPQLSDLSSFKLLQACSNLGSNSFKHIQGSNLLKIYKAVSC